MITEDFISIEKTLDIELEKVERQHIRKIIGYLTEVVRGYKVPMVNGSYVIPGEYNKPFPQDINYVLNQIIAKMRLYINEELNKK